MAERQLSVRSAKASEIAHRLALRERRTVAAVVERALEDYDRKTTGREPAELFYKRISEQYGVDNDLEEVIQEGRIPHEGIDL
ncbi:MAG: plasmid stabilization protein [Mesorhizobium sp.]|nr:plasmid stabilization protein [Mesorhizobium sp.]